MCSLPGRILAVAVLGFRGGMPTGHDPALLDAARLLAPSRNSSPPITNGSEATPHRLGAQAPPGIGLRLPRWHRIAARRLARMSISMPIALACCSAMNRQASLVAIIGRLTGRGRPLSRGPAGKVAARAASLTAWACSLSLESGHVVPEARPGTGRDERPFLSPLFLEGFQVAAEAAVTGRDIAEGRAAGPIGAGKRFMSRPVGAVPSFSLRRAACSFSTRRRTSEGCARDFVEVAGIENHSRRGWVVTIWRLWRGNRSSPLHLTEEFRPGPCRTGTRSAHSTSPSEMRTSNRRLVAAHHGRMRFWILRPPQFFAHDLLRVNRAELG